MSKIEQANRAADLIMPKLQAYKRSCGSGDIHDVMMEIALVGNYQKLMNTTQRQDPEEIAEELLDVVRRAEHFLISAVTRTFG